MAEQQDATFFSAVLPSQLNQCEGAFIKLQGKVISSNNGQIQLQCSLNNAAEVASITNCNENFEQDAFVEIRGQCMQNSEVVFSECTLLNPEFDLNLAEQTIYMKQKYGNLF